LVGGVLGLLQVAPLVLVLAAAFSLAAISSWLLAHAAAAVFDLRLRVLR